MKTFAYTITDPVGIHARPAGTLAKKAAEDPQGAEMAAALESGGDWVDPSALDAVAAVLAD